ncbi:YDG domain-containing protein [Collimonas humicola]|uniref:YDG domain-containing protein n=1 Tax=Collimonas humicola TaxID=2825886 RepID=UPI001B8B5632|nr:YDG domain-containing protein [Collimonas humicola]
MKRHGSMNHIYRLVWSTVTNGWIAVAETTRGRGKGGRRKLVAAALSLTAVAAQAAPTGGQVVAGSGSIRQSGATTTISQTSQNATLNWSGFNIAPQETVNFVQPSVSAIAVNRIFDANGTQILGHLNANGQVFLINPNGILFGSGAQVNVGGLVASTLDLRDASLNGNARTFSGNGPGSVVNQGSITAANGGYVALLGNHVSNQGTISAQQGAVALGAGNAVTLTFSGNSLLQLQVDQSVLNSAAENGGLIRADGGRVIMSAGAKDALLASVVNNTGVIEARTVENQGGTITLLGGMAAGTVNVGGTLDASAPAGGNGGFIETSAANVKVASSTRITTAAAQGLAGTWLIDPTDFTIAPSGGDQTGAALNTALGLGNVTISSASGGAGTSGNINVDDTVSWSGHKLTLNASNDVNINATMTASGFASLDLEPGSGHVNVALGSAGFNGRVNFSGSGVLTMNNHVYTVINSLGTATSSGDGTLQGTLGNLAGYYALGSDINAAATSAWNSGAGFTPIGGKGVTVLTPAQEFSGVFDGLGHTVSGLTINDGSLVGIGMIGAVGAAGVVRNVGLLGGSVAVTSSNYTGALVGQNFGKISNSFSTATVSASSNATFIGGLVGENSGGTITRSYAGGTLNAGAAASNVGGLLGGLQGGTVSYSYATGNVTGTSNYVGGLIGYSYGGGSAVSVISNSYATGTVSGSSYVGGLLGSNYGFSGPSTISNSYATGAVSGTSAIGGLVGHNYGGAGGSPAISNSYATGSVTGAAGASFVGGLVGNNAGAGALGGTITDSYSTGSVSAGGGSTSVGGLVGNNAGTVTGSFWDKTSSGQATSAAGTGMTTANMQNQANFTSSTAANGNLNPAWDFSNTWLISGGYPLLLSGMTALTVTANNATSIFNGAAYASNNGVTYTGLNGYRYGGTPAGLLGSISYGGTSQAAINAGTYTITASGLSSTGQQGYIVTFVNGTLTINPLALIGTLSAGSSVYGSALLPGTVTFTNMVAGHVVTAGPVSVNTTGLTSSSGHLTAGTHNGIESVGTVLTGTDASNYTFAGATGNYTVTPLALTGSIATGSSTYGSALVPGAANFTNAVSGDALGTATVGVNTTGQTSSSGHLVAGTHSGIESVSALSGADAGNYTFTGVTGDYSVNQLALSATVGAGSSTYGSTLTPGAVNFTNALSGDVVTPGAVAVNTAGLTSSSGNLTAGTHNGIESVGTALGGADAGNYTFAGATGNYTVSPLALTGSIGTGSSTYGSVLAPGVANFTNAVTGDVLGTATVGVNTTGLTSSSGHLIAGTHNGIETVSALSGTDAGNYTFTGVTGNYTVNQLALNGTLAAGSSTYGSTLAPGAVNFTNAVSGDLVTPGAVTVNTTGLTSSSGHLIAGSHTGIESVGTVLGGADAGNYTFAGATGDYTVAQLALTGAVAAGSSVYGAALAPGAASFTNAVSGDLVTPGAVTVNTTGLTSSSGNLTAGTHNGIESVGTALGGADAGNYTFAGATGNYTVSPLALTGSIGVGSSTYGSALTPGAANFTNAVTGDVLGTATVGVNTTGLTSSSGHLIAGTHNGIETVSGLSGADAGNYTFSGITGNYVVNQLALTGSIGTGSSTYGAALAPGVANFTNAVTGDVLGTATVGVNTTGLTSSSGHLIAGTHTGIESVSALSGADAGNYTFTGPSGDYTVSQLALTGAIATGSSTYGAALVPGAASFTNAVAGDALGTATVAIDTTGLTSSSGHLIAGTHNGIESVSALSGADAGNYTFAGPTGNYTVTPLALTGSIATGSSTYGSALVPGAANFTNAVSGDALGTATVGVNTTGQTSSSGHLVAGTHSGIESVSALSGADAGNYTFTGVTGDYSVNQLALNGTLAAGSSTYGSTLAPGAVNFTNAVSGDLVTPGAVTVNTTGLTSSSGHLIAGSHTGIESVGTVLGGADAGNYTFAGATGDYTVAQLALTGTVAAGSSTYGAALVPGAANFTNAVSGDALGTATIAINTAGLTSSSGHLTAGTHNGIESVSALSGADAGNYTFTGVTGNYTVSPLALNATVGAGSSTYGSALVPGAANFTNAVSGDLVTPGAVTVNTTGLTSSSGHLIAGTHTGIESVGAALGGADAGNYTFAGASGDYTVAQLALTGTVAAGSSVYGSVLAPGAASFTNVVSGDLVTPGAVAVNTTGLTSSSGHLTAGTHNGIESVGTTLGGADAGNYTFAGATGNYTVSPLALTGSIGAGSSIYGSALTPGAVSFTNAVTGDVLGTATVAVNTSGLTSSSGHLIAGTHTGIESVSALSGADAGNYTFAAPTGDYAVSQLALTGSIGAGSSIYGAVLTPGAASFTNAVTGDVLGTATVAVNTTGLTSSSGHLIAGTHNGIESVSALSGADAGNYTYAGPTGNYTVSPLALAGSIAAGSSTYGAALAPGALSISNVISGDLVSAPGVSVNTAGLTSSSGHLTAGTHVGIESANGALGGADASNYILGSITGDYTVSRQSVTVTASGVSKVYDATISGSAILTGGGLIGGDKVTFTDTSANFGDKNAGTGKTIAISGISASGADAGNYVVSNTTASTTADITPLAITVAAIGANKTYDGNTTATVTLSGGLAGDAVTFSDTSANFADKNAGAGKTVTVAGISASGADAGNYTVSGTTTTSATITPATLTYNAAPASSIAGQTPSGLSGTLSGLVGGDTLDNATTGSLAWTTNAQPTSQPGLYAIDGGGLSAMNYVFVQAAGNATALTLKPGAAPVPVQNVITALDSVFAPSHAGINLAALDLVQFNIQPPNNKIGDGMNGVELKITGGGVKLPDNIVSTDE